MAGLYEVVLEQRYFQQQSVNRWNYVGTGVGAGVSGSFALASAFGGIYDLVAVPPAYPPNTIIQRIRDLQNSSAQFVQLTVFNVYDPTDFYSTPFIPSLFGALVGDPSSPVLAYGFRTNRITRAIRRGMKRFVGVDDAYATAGGVFTGTATALMAALADEMSETLSYDDEGNTLTFAPSVASKQRYNPVTGLNDPDGTAYRYYSSLALQTPHIAQNVVWEPYVNVRTQRSRQYGHGS